MNIYSILSNLVLVIHFAFVAFIVGGLVAIWIGRWLRWEFIRNPYFRLAHLLAMAIVLLEAVVGIICPLTSWEDALRLRTGQAPSYKESFMQHWIGRILFYDLGDDVFTIIYAGVFALFLLTFWLVPPRKRR